MHKTNVLTFAGDLYQRVVDEVGAAEYPDVERTTSTSTPRASISSISPARFDVIVTDNMFGDIITDLGAMIQGGMGIAAGGNINPDGVSMFEPIGGTAPTTRARDDQPARRDRRDADAATSSASARRRSAWTPGSGSPARR